MPGLHQGAFELKQVFRCQLRVLSYLLGMLRNALDQPDLRGRSEGTTWSALEIAVGLGNLLVNEQNMEIMLDRDVVSLLVSLIGKGGVTEKECAANALWVIAKDSKGKAKIKEWKNGMESTQWKSCHAYAPAVTRQFKRLQREFCWS